MVVKSTTLWKDIKNLGTLKNFTWNLIRDSSGVVTVNSVLNSIKMTSLIIHVINADLIVDRSF